MERLWKKSTGERKRKEEEVEEGEEEEEHKVRESRNKLG